MQPPGSQPAKRVGPVPAARRVAHRLEEAGNAFGIGLDELEDCAGAAPSIDIYDLGRATAGFELLYHGSARFSGYSAGMVNVIDQHAEMVNTLVPGVTPLRVD